MTISNLPPKGTSDWFPQEYRIRKYIFDTWRSVCTRFGYEEYLTPVVESAEVYRAKSGEDIGGKELMTMTDRAGRELSLRPEMTPSVTRMVTRIYDSAPKPMRLFSIANFFRNEKPQRGRNREFWQLNADIFGSNSANADIEVLQLALEIMQSFNPPAGSFTMFINNRKLIDFILNQVAQVTEDQRTEVVRTLDKWEKLSREDFVAKLVEIGLQSNQVEGLIKFMQSSNAQELIQNLPELATNEGYQETQEIIEKLTSLGYGEWIKFQPNIIRGFDYYDGMVFEVFDNNPENNRSMFGGGRYNGLARIFGANSFPATGFAPGDETTRLFLESWNLVPQDLKQEVYYVPLLSEDLYIQTTDIIKPLRNEGKNVIAGLEVQGVGKALDTGNKIAADFVIIFGENEQSRGVYILKDMNSGEQVEKQINN
jgi:histidyl-tRNA synthetase